MSVPNTSQVCFPKFPSSVVFFDLFGSLDYLLYIKLYPDLPTHPKTSVSVCHTENKVDDKKSKVISNIK